MKQKNQKKSLKEKTKEYFRKNKTQFLLFGGYCAGIAAYALTLSIRDKIKTNNDYKNGSDFTRYMMDKGYTAKEAEMWKKGEICFANDTEDFLGISVKESWQKYREEHPEEFMQW